MMKNSEDVTFYYSLLARYYSLAIYFHAWVLLWRLIKFFLIHVTLHLILDEFKFLRNYVPYVRRWKSCRYRMVRYGKSHIFPASHTYVRIISFNLTPNPQIMTLTNGPFSPICPKLILKVLKYISSAINVWQALNKSLQYTYALYVFLLWCWSEIWNYEYHLSIVQILRYSVHRVPDKL